LGGVRLLVLTKGIFTSDIGADVTFALAIELFWGILFPLELKEILEIIISVSPCVSVV
jgi:hypothetical protein